MKPILMLVCLIGLLYQVYEVSDFFLAYHTVTSVKIAMEAGITVPSFSVCFRAVDFLMDPRNGWKNRRRFKNGHDQHKTNPNVIPFLSNRQVMDILDSATVKEIFHHAPLSDSLIKSCRLRQVDSMSLMYYEEARDCNVLFNVTAYVSREFVCYHVIKANVTVYDLWQVSFVPEHFNLMYSITLNQEYLSYVQYYTIYIHEPDTSMLFDSAQTRIFRRLTKDSVSAVQTTYQTVTNKRLPAPYETACKNFSHYKSYTEYAMECINNLTVQNLGKVFFSGFIWNVSTADTGYTDPFEIPTPSELATIPASRALEYPFLTGRDLLDHRIDTQMKVYKALCFKAIPVCKFKHTYSKLTVRDDFQMNIDMMLPRDPMVQVTHYPRQTTIEFLLYMLTCFGSWFGICIYGTFMMIYGYILICYRKVFQCQIFGRTLHGKLYQKSNRSRQVPLITGMDGADDRYRRNVIKFDHRHRMRYQMYNHARCNNNSILKKFPFLYHEPKVSK